jgi:hypothetical protein
MIILLYPKGSLMIASTKSTGWARPSLPWQCPDGKQILSINAPRVDWLIKRRELIGSSDVAKILGASKYGDGYSVWAEKTGRVPLDDGATDHTKRGQIFEGPIAQLWATRYYEHPIELRRMGLIRSSIWDKAGCSVDFLSVCESGKCLVEIKSAVDTTEYEGDEVPLDVQLQTQWQLFGTGRDHVHVVVLGSRFIPAHRVMLRDQAVINWMVEELQPWWVDYVETDIPPEPTARASKTIQRMFGNPNVGEKYIVDGDLAPLVRRMKMRRADMAAMFAEHDNDEAVLRAAVGNATEIMWPDETPVATWRPIATIDGANEQWRKAHSDLIEPYMQTKPALNVKTLVADHPELIESGSLRYRRSWNWS